MHVINMSPGTGSFWLGGLLVLLNCRCSDAQWRRSEDLTPAALAQLVGDQLMQHKEIFLVWNYGGALVFDGLWKANETFGTEYASNLVVKLGVYEIEPTTAAYKAIHNASIEPGSTIGDLTGLFPIAYLNRALSYGSGPARRPSYTNHTDMLIAQYVADHYIMTWPVRLADGCVSRNSGWAGQKGKDSFLWGDDQYMGLTLVSRLAIATNRSDYAKFAATQAVLFEKHMRDPKDGLYYHGYNDADKETSCCKWGRANGWGLFSHAEVMAAVSAFPELAEEANMVKGVLQRHIAAILPFQSDDGRWHQLVNDTDSFLETSCTAMFTSAIARSIMHGWIDGSMKEKLTAVAQKGFAGLGKTVSSTGVVSGVCSGTGIQTDANAYRHRPTDYLISGPGGVGSVLTAAVDIHNLNMYLQNERIRRW